MVTSSFLGWDLLSEQGLMSSFPLQRPLFSPSARLAALFFPILPLLPVEQARWDLPDRRYRLFTLLHETISSALPISLRISWDELDLQTVPQPITDDLLFEIIIADNPLPLLGTETSAAG
jgi:hypothetical protein